MGIRYEEFEPLLIVLAFGVLGVVMAMIIKTLYDDGIIIPAYLTGTLPFPV